MSILSLRHIFHLMSLIDVIQLEVIHTVDCPRSELLDWSVQRRCNQRWYTFKGSWLLGPLSTFDLMMALWPFRIAMVTRQAATFPAACPWRWCRRAIRPTTNLPCLAGNTHRIHVPFGKWIGRLRGKHRTLTCQTVLPPSLTWSAFISTGLQITRFLADIKAFTECLCLPYGFQAYSNCFFKCCLD